MSRVRRAGGFTLVEMLVAVTVLALLFGALMPVFQQGLAVLGSGDRHTRAVMLAQSLLAPAATAFGPEDVASPDSEQGREGDFTWRLQRLPYDSNDGAPELPPELPLKLVRVSAVVTWDGGGEGITLTTLRLERDR